MAFEDSLGGVQSARAAGLHTFGILAGLQEDQLRNASAQNVIRDFDDVLLWKWLRIQAGKARYRHY